MEGLALTHIIRHLSAVVMTIAVMASSAWASPDQPLDADDQIRLKRLLVQDCGSCHGLQMKGGLGSGLTPADLADKPVPSLVATILHGRPGTAMPPWQGLLTEQEAQWLIEQLLEGL